MESYWLHARMIGPQNVASVRRSAVERALVGADSSFPFISVEEARSRYPQDRARVEVKDEPASAAREDDDAHPLLD
jgi:hypothetical protein